MKMRAVVEIWLESLIGNFTLGGLHSAMEERSFGIFYLAVGPSAAGKQVKISSPFLKCNRCNDEGNNDDRSEDSLDKMQPMQ